MTDHTKTSRSSIHSAALRNALTTGFRLSILILFACTSACTTIRAADFGEDWEDLDSGATGEWWAHPFEGNKEWLKFVKVPRDEVVAFGLYTVSQGTLKLSVQLYPLMPDEQRQVRLEFLRGDEWIEEATASVYELGWSAHFRFDNWDESLDVRYRARHGDRAMFEGTIRKTPSAQDEIVVATLSCNSNRDRGDRDSIVRNLTLQDPDLLFFAGDQSYDHREHTAAWLLWGKQFREIIKDRPVVTIPDDHDIGQPNLWGQGGVKAPDIKGHDGGYFFPAAYVNMVHRCQTWHLPDPHDPTPIHRGITTYYTSYKLGGIDFAIISDRQFKSGPKGNIPRMGPRADHINDPAYDRSSIDLPELRLLGERQLNFLRNWGTDWSQATMKCVLSQTNFAGAVHLHGKPENRLLADLDSNGWPQTGRRKALQEIRRSMAFHLAGDQHIAVVTKHGIEKHRDGPISFINPAIVNSVYGRWWWPENEKPGHNPIQNSPLPWTGDYEDGFGNLITMYAYANPSPDAELRTVKRAQVDEYGEGYGLARFDKRERTVSFECWPRYADASNGDAEQFPGWPLRFSYSENDGRAAVEFLPEVHFPQTTDPVVQIVEESTGDILYTLRIKGNSFRPKVYRSGKYTIKAGLERPNQVVLENISSSERPAEQPLEILF